MKIALFSPLPPAKSGIANYTAMLLPFLSNYFEIDLYSDKKACQTERFKGRALYDYSAFKANAARYRAVVYMIGNNVDFHRQIYREAVKTPGIVVLHEWVLHHLISGLTIGEDNYPAYYRQLWQNYGLRAFLAGKRAIKEGRANQFFFRYPFNRRLLKKSKAVIVHNNWMAKQLADNFSHLETAVIPHLLLNKEPLNFKPKEFRKENGLDNSPLIVAMGHMTRAKRIEQVLAAYQLLIRQKGINCQLALIGDNKADFDLIDLAKRYGLENEIIISNYLDDTKFLQWLEAADICLNLRYPTAGETSGTMLKALGRAKAVLVSNLAPYNEVPDGCCVKVDLVENEIELLTLYLEKLVKDKKLRESIGRYAKEYVEEVADPQAIAARYAHFILEQTKKRRYPTAEKILPNEETYVLGLLNKYKQNSLDKIWSANGFRPIQPLSKLGVNVREFKKKAATSYFLAYKKIVKIVRCFSALPAPFKKTWSSPLPGRLSHLALGGWSIDSVKEQPPPRYFLKGAGNAKNDANKLSSEGKAPK